MPEGCSGKCPLYDAGILAMHSTISPDDPELLAALRSFAQWFYVKDQNLDEQIRFAAQLYTREDHAGTCIPKTLLFAHYKQLQLDVYGAREVSPVARAALKGLPVASWPEGDLAGGDTWAEMFFDYTRSYDVP